jgi:hypothetical protein
VTRDRYVIRPDKKNVVSKRKNPVIGSLSDRYSPKNSIAFEPSVHQKIARMAFDRGITFSSVVRELVDKGMQ